MTLFEFILILILILILISIPIPKAVDQPLEATHRFKQLMQARSRSPPTTTLMHAINQNSSSAGASVADSHPVLRRDGRATVPPPELAAGL